MAAPLRLIRSCLVLICLTEQFLTETDDYPCKAFGHSKTYTQLCVDESIQKYKIICVCLFACLSLSLCLTETDDYPSKAFGHSKTYTQLCVDEKAMTLFVPVNGAPVRYLFV